MNVGNIDASVISGWERAKCPLKFLALVEAQTGTD